MEREVTIRSAGPQDMPAMLAITRDVWGGHDYVPRAWSSWLAGHGGVLLAAELEGKMVGFQHVDVHPDRTAWLEGIRVHEVMQGRGIATRLLAAGIDWARFNGLGAARLSTSTDNPVSNRLAERAGMKTIATFVPVRLCGRAESQSNSVRLARPDEGLAVRRVLDRWPGAPFYTEGWTAYRLTDDRLRLLLASDQVIVHGDDDPDAIAIATAEVERPYPRPGLLRGTAEGTAAILAYLRRSLHPLGADSMRGQLEIDDDQLENTAPHGLERAWEHNMRLWQIELS